MATDSSHRGALRLVSSAAEAPPGPSFVPVSLAAAPFRPGELPTIVWLVLDAEARAELATSAARARLPAELWVRIGVEAGRLQREIASAVGRTEAWVTSALDDAASIQAPAGVEALAGAGLARYAEHLEAPHPCGGIPPTLPLRLPEEMSSTWSRDATSDGQNLSLWVTARLRAAPAGCVRWEIASARASQPLGEWAYASSLRSLASAIA